jgi:hypothetical protein
LYRHVHVVRVHCNELKGFTMSEKRNKCHINPLLIRHWLVFSSSLVCVNSSLICVNSSLVIPIWKCFICYKVLSKSLKKLNHVFGLIPTIKRCRYNIPTFCCWNYELHASVNIQEQSFPLCKTLPTWIFNIKWKMDLSCNQLQDNFEDTKGTIGNIYGHVFIWQFKKIS